VPSFKDDESPIELAGDGRDVWERQPGESIKRFSQFVTYRDAGLTRTLANTAKTLTLSAPYVRAVSLRFRWPERVAAFDREHDRAFLAKMATDRKKAAQLHVALGTALFSKVRERLNTLQVNTLTPTEMTRLAEVALKLQQSGLGLPDSTVQVIGDPVQPVSHQDVTGLSLAERADLLDRTIAELQRRRSGVVSRPTGEQDETAQGGAGPE
jgi:hypothetical protein